LKTPLLALTICALCLASLSAAPLFTECPATGLNTGCQFLLTIGPGGTVSVAMDPNAPNNQPYDASEDALIGVLNNSTRTITSLPLSSNASANGGIFGFDGDGPCTQTPHSASCPPNNAFPGDTSSNGFPGDPTGYGGPGVTFTGIAPGNQSGTVKFAGIAPGGTAWFGLEEALSSASQIIPGTPGGTGGGTGGGVPEPASIAFFGTGMSLLGLMTWRRNRS
jgi:PEP-CTERM motif